MARFDDAVLGWLAPLGVILLALSVPVGLAFGLNALIDHWLATVAILLFVGVGLYEWFFDRENFWVPDGE
jgi:hypothetical protein